MQFTGSFTVPAPRQRVWEGLNDPDLLRQCIPGCEELTRLSATEFEGKIVAKVGPVKASFSGKVTLSELDPPNGYTISGEGKGGVAGFAKGGAKVRLTDDGPGTKLEYAVDASVGGKLAQIGSRLIEGTVNQTAEQFFARFGELVSAGQASAASSEAEAEAAVAMGAPAARTKPGGSKWMWIAVAVVIAAAVIVALVW
jgi:carbon monoxide dehydrogenase subunit G